MICIDCEHPVYINYTKKTTGCKVCGWETFFRAERWSVKDANLMLDLNYNTEWLMVIVDIVRER